MTILNLVLGVLVCVVVPLIVWWGIEWIRVMLAVGLVATQVLLMFYMENLGRKVMSGVIHSGGPVREVSEALQVLGALRWPALIAVIISGAGLFVLAAFHRRGRAPKMEEPAKS